MLSLPRFSTLWAFSIVGDPLVYLTLNPKTSTYCNPYCRSPRNWESRNFRKLTYAAEVPSPTTQAPKLYINPSAQALPKSRNAKPQTPNRKPQTPNPRPQTLNPKPQTLNPKPSTGRAEVSDFQSQVKSLTGVPPIHQRPGCSVGEFYGLGFRV